MASRSTRKKRARDDAGHQALDDLFENILTSTAPAIVEACDAIEPLGMVLRETAIVVADLHDVPARTLVRRIVGAEQDIDDLSLWISAVHRADVIRALRASDVHSSADFVGGTTDVGTVRVVIAAKGKVRCVDVDMADLADLRGDD